MDSKKRVLVTGFGPFEGHPVNASWEAVSTLRDVGAPEGVELFVAQLPVEYDAVSSRIPQLWSEFKPDLVVHVGVSGLATGITFETCAYNNGYRKMDVEGCIPSDSCCVSNQACESLKTGVDVEGIAKELQSKLGMEACTSTNAGRYLCEFSFFTSLCQDHEKTMFIHVPCLDNPFSKEELAKALRFAIEAHFHRHC